MEKFKSHFSKAELVSFFQTFVSSLAVDATFQFNAVVGGDWSEPALVALGISALRSAIKAAILLLDTTPRGGGGGGAGGGGYSTGNSTGTGA